MKAPAVPNQGYEAELQRAEVIKDAVSQALSGRGVPELLDAEPGKRYCVGVLNPADHTLDAHARLRRSRRLPDALGFDARVVPYSEQISGVAHLDFALYYRVIPEFGDQEEWGRNVSASGKQPLRQKFRRLDVTVPDLPFSVQLDPTMSVVDADVSAMNSNLTKAIENAKQVIRADPGLYPSDAEIKIANASMATALAYAAAVTGAGGTLPQWAAEFDVRVIKTGDGYRLSTLLKNRSQSEGMHADQLFDVRLSVKLIAGTFQSVPFAAASLDYRYETLSWGKGVNAVLAVDPDEPTRAWTETLPVHLQRRLRAKHVGSATETSRLMGTDTAIALAEVLEHLRQYADSWRESNVDFAGVERQMRDEDLSRYETEIERYREGMEALAADSQLLQAFQLANESAHKRGLGRWFLFQLVFMVLLMPSLLARENAGSRWRAHLDIVDVLWFPTGGGKTEAYFGAILVAMFYDRIRGKKRGTTAWLRYPLRMLSIQQLQRLVDFVVRAEEVRRAKIHKDGDDAFTVGFYVGAENTLNELTTPFDQEQPIVAERKKLDADGDLPERKVLQRCPFCGSAELRIDVLESFDELRMLHVCADCHGIAPIFISDSEIYRYLPTVVVGTVDRLARAGQTDHFSHLFSQVTKVCPKHGYAGISGCVEPVCKQKNLVDVEATYDPTPALILQDELHLLKESLGTYDSHYEGFLNRFAAAVGTHLPPKRIAATATIERYERHVQQLYGSHVVPRRFPEKGRLNEESAYIEPDSSREKARLYVGILPFGATTDEVVASVANVVFASAHTYLQEPGAVASVADNYELSLIYVNMKNAAGNIGSVIQKGLKVSTLTGERTFKEVRQAIHTIETDLQKPRDERLNCLVATSIIGHGVDLERLNIMAFSGYPGAAADYIQASSRVGRSHVGIVFTVFNSMDTLDRSTYVHFHEYHERLYQLVQPVAINKFSQSSVRRTFTGVFAATLLNIIALEDGKSFARGSVASSSYSSGVLNDARLDEQMRLTYDIASLEGQPEVHSAYVDLISQRTRSAKVSIQNGEEFKTYRRLRPPVIASLREVHEQVSFFPFQPKIGEITKVRS